MSSWSISGRTVLVFKTQLPGDGRMATSGLEVWKKATMRPASLCGGRLSMGCGVGSVVTALVKLKFCGFFPSASLAQDPRRDGW